jgi:anti-sigma factor RsiW
MAWEPVAKDRSLVCRNTLSLAHKEGTIALRCEEFRAVLSEYIEGELDPMAVEAAETHLLVCPACSATLRGVQQVRRALHHLGQERPPAGGTGATMRPAPGSRTATGPARLGGRPRAAAIALLMGAGLVLWPAARQGESEPTGMAWWDQGSLTDATEEALYLFQETEPDPTAADRSASPPAVEVRTVSF